MITGLQGPFVSPVRISGIKVFSARRLIPHDALTKARFHLALLCLSEPPRLLPVS